MSNDQTVDFPNPNFGGEKPARTEKPARNEGTRPLDVSIDLSNSRVSVGSPLSSGTGNSGQRFQEATRQLLHQRLLYVAITLTGMILMALMLGVLSADSTTGQTGLRVASLGMTLCVLAALVWQPQASMLRLRSLEILLFAVPMAEACMVQILGTNQLLQQQRFGEIATLQVTLSSAVAVFIALYGVFIPARWVRTAIVTGIVALLPTAVAFSQTQVTPELREYDMPNLTMTAVLLTMATVATLGARFVNTARREAISARRFGQYQLTEELGRGGMGVVYRAEHQLLKRPAAIKLIRAESAFNADAIQRFETEVQLSATLSHWNTVQIYDYGRTNDGDFYYVMEYLEGESLQQRLKRTGPLSPGETEAIIGQMCQGLAEAHSRGMVHRDLKPANIFLAQVGGHYDVVKILDFGLATDTRDPESENRSVSGSPSYMSPEQITGNHIDQRSDIYAIGCVLFECLTGQPLFAGDTVQQVIQKHLQGIDQIPALPDGKIGFGPIIGSCVSLDKNDRFESVEHLQRALTTQTR